MSRHFILLLAKLLAEFGSLEAYGVRQNAQAPVDHVTLIPPFGVDGPEVDFRIPVPAGATVTVLKVVRTNPLFDPEMTFIVALEGAALPVTAPVRIDLFRGNEGQGDLQLNPAIYRRLPDTAQAVGEHSVAARWHGPPGRPS